MVQRWRFTLFGVLYEMMTLKIWYHLRLSRLICVFLAKPTPNRCLEIREFVKASITENNAHSGATANAESINQPWGTDLPAMLTGASIAHAATIAERIFEASASRRSHGDLVATITVRAGLSSFSSRHRAGGTTPRWPVFYRLNRSR
jgi:hypothetical protein